MQPSEGNGSNHRNRSKSEVLTGAAVLVCAQFAAASTASCVKALPIETPSMLRGLWRQTLTSFIFSVFTIVMWLLRIRRDAKDESHMHSDPGEETHLLQKHGSREKTYDGLSATTRIVLVALTVVGATLLNDTIVVALRYASSAAVMCLCNTTPVWLILYAIVDCKVESPGAITIMGATLSLFGTIICSTGEGDDGSEYENGRLGAIIATIGAIGGAIYMTACRRLSPCGLHPIHLSLIINIGMMATTFLLCLPTLPNGITFFSTDINNGFFGFLNPKANPAAFLHSIFPDLGGNFGIMLALSYFEPLIVSMVMLTEPLNASIIAMYAVNESPPSTQTIIGVSIVLVGCAIVLWESNKDANDDVQLRKSVETNNNLDAEEEKGYGATEDHAEQMERRLCQRRRSSGIVYSQLGKIAPQVAAQVICQRSIHRRHSLPERCSSRDIQPKNNPNGIRPQRYDSM
mmetsp:Transcript_53984/g.114680  ORF Transcript_53984/g.114680 Transcript_53984/m.114680 type:complete len:461 (-) Transcript_53984:30-1412(-)|eukprot:CAMPEP_0172548082 /NCGR_PEP_ID=MMETSP1067-20121228/17472_1 /TAXON_ID=265564 ORGANISM="Thalassiosira punctigera, Strain Tpunct2005C2" /NCGR_SAMPLE_ID=MMETSP1067 /ASSEMBLY_ACC=CAM_ASM_000444 /LENGTH=460 /DNA_ID=CAMNT_0013335267 /DNA_START=164 /DNA_END=1546 /DNA_ORIENTATION=-